MLQQILFILVTAGAFGWAYRQFGRIRSNIALGKPEVIEGDTGARWKNVLLVAFGQKKMFKEWTPAVFHFFIYAAFVITQIELIEILIDGFTGRHRVFAEPLGGFYTFVIGFIEILSLFAFVATIVFLARRNLLKIPRFVKSELDGWPRLDANLILIGELILLVGIFSMNGADTLLQQIEPEHYPSTGTLPVSSWLGPMLFGGLAPGTLAGIERFGWWLHILTVYAFLNYLPISKHLHIVLAFPNVYFSRLKPRGEMDNMPEIMNEVKSMMGLIEETPAEGDLPVFGVNDIFGLSWKNLLDAYSCTECGRCTAQCPANLTGKKLSPRKVMMDIRDRVEEVATNLATGDATFIDPASGASKLEPANYADGKSLFDRITPEELHACTTCNACVEACPVMINPLEPILAMRRYEILTASSGPSEWIPMFNSIENNGAVWQVSDARTGWIGEG
ncbi:MAG: (Fe-S)-binding protein [Rhodothermales bacterium]